MRTTIHNRRGTNHLIDPRFRSERLQLQSDRVNTFLQFLRNRIQKKTHVISNEYPKQSN